MTDPVTSLPTPPRQVTDAESREIEVRRADADDTEALVEMYLAFDPADRAQGIPPVGEAGIREWLGGVLSEQCFNVVAWYGDRAVGHATLVPDITGDYELAIFVLDDYQGARVGTELVRSLLGWAQSEGIASVWLTVERWNDPAIRLYETVGFEITDSESFEMEMTIQLTDQTESTG